MFDSAASRALRDYTRALINSCKLESRSPFLFVPLYVCVCVCAASRNQLSVRSRVRRSNFRVTLLTGISSGAARN